MLARRRSNLRRAVVAVFFLIASLGVSSSPAFAYNVLPGTPHWQRTNTVHAYMFVEDFTGPNWPVYSAQITWNQSCCVGAYYASPNTCSFHCVPAYEGYYGGTGWVALTSYSFDSSGHFTSAMIQYNDSYSLTYSQRLQTTCQEQGHALGLDHTPSDTSSCMYPTVPGGSTTPNGHDYWTLANQIYNH